MKTRQPNILFFLPDQHRPDWLGCNPELPLRTPDLDRLCEHGIRFTNAYTPSPVCSPARACIGANPSLMLFDVQKDPQELIDIADTHPRIAKKLAEKLESATRRPEPNVPGDA